MDLYWHSVPVQVRLLFPHNNAIGGIHGPCALVLHMWYVYLLVDKDAFWNNVTKWFIWWPYVYWTMTVKLKLGFIHWSITLETWYLVNNGTNMVYLTTTHLWNLTVWNIVTNMSHLRTEKKHISHCCLQHFLSPYTARAPILIWRNWHFKPELGVIWTEMRRSQMRASFENFKTLNIVLV